MFIDGIAILGYRSFGEEFQRIGPCAKVNLLIGQNNSGKSNVLSWLHRNVNNLRQGRLALDESDRHLGAQSGRTGFGIGLAYQRERALAHISQIVEIENSCKKILDSMKVNSDDSIVWFDYESPSSGQGYSMVKPEVNVIRSVLQQYEWQRVWEKLTQQRGGGINEHWIPETVRRLSPISRDVPEVLLVPAFRQVNDGKAKERIISGADLINELAKLQNPPYTKQIDKEKLINVNTFLQSVTENTTAILEIPHERDMIIVHMDGKTLPLRSLGTGIEEVIILASAATVHDGKIMCIEEPEIHLHPILQRKLLRYLLEKTNNQYFITTHSAHLLDVKGVAAFRIKLVDGASEVTPILTDTMRWDVCRDLGYRASDIVQTNCILWVEGPSDRVYLNHWIKHVSPELTEGADYSIMFYGGRLLCHLTAQDEDVEEFISLIRLNRNMGILIDSDRRKKGDKLNDSKLRVKDGFEGKEAFTWVTAGREVENYLPKGLLREAVEAVKPGFGDKVCEGQYARVLPTDGGQVCVNKIKVAREIAKHDVDLSVLDLENQVKKLVEFIKNANRP